VAFLKHVKETKKEEPEAKARPKAKRIGAVHERPDPVSKCKVCAQLDSDKLEQLKNEWLVEGKESDDLAAKWGFRPKVMHRHIRRCLFNKHRSRYDRLRVLLDEVFEDIDLAREAFRDQPTFNNSASYQGLLREFRSTLTDLEHIQNAEELGDELIDLVINPLILRMTQIIASESGSLKEDLASRVGDVEAESLVHDLVDRVKERFSEEVRGAQQRMNDALSAKDKNRQRALKGAVAKPVKLKAL